MGLGFELTGVRRQAAANALQLYAHLIERHCPHIGHPGALIHPPLNAENAIYSPTFADPQGQDWADLVFHNLRHECRLDKVFNAIVPHSPRSAMPAGAIVYQPEREAELGYLPLIILIQFSKHILGDSSADCHDSSQRHDSAIIPEAIALGFMGFGLIGLSQPRLFKTLIGADVPLFRVRRDLSLGTILFLMLSGQNPQRVIAAYKNQLSPQALRSLKLALSDIRRKKAELAQCVQMIERASL